MERLKRSWGLASAQVEAATALSPKTIQAILVGIVLLIAVFRLATISVPSLEWTSWKEIDYLTISRNFWPSIEKGASLKSMAHTRPGCRHVRRRPKGQYRARHTWR